MAIIQVIELKTKAKSPTESHYLLMCNNEEIKTLNETDTIIQVMCLPTLSGVQGIIK